MSLCTSNVSSCHPRQSPTPPSRPPSAETILQTDDPLPPLLTPLLAPRPRLQAKRGERQPTAAYEATRIANAERPDEAFTTERAVKSGKANAASGRIFVTIPADHFGPITAEYDPEKNRVRTTPSLQPANLRVT